METLVAERQPRNRSSAEHIEQKIRALDWRDIQLWCIGFVVLVVLAAGFVALLAPQLVWHIGAVVARQQDIVQLIFGLTALLILLNLYLFQQRLVIAADATRVDPSIANRRTESTNGRSHRSV